MIPVTKTYLPDREKFKQYVDQIFDSGWLTNNGLLVRQLTERLASYLNVKNLLLVSNGTLALQVAYKLLGLKGHVITTPYSFVATTSSLVWEGLEPVFADIDRDSMNIDPRQIRQRVTKDTQAIVPVHVYGNPCEVEEIDRIAGEYDLKIVYDAAHAFGIHYKDRSVLNYGDISVLSFHATKTFHTIEGGALIIRDDGLYEKAKEMINFGIKGPSHIVSLGINAKMNEFQAAMGLCLLDEMKDIFEARKAKYKVYERELGEIPSLGFQKRNPHGDHNYSYFPVLFENEEVLHRVMKDLQRHDIFARRYFHPSLNTLNYLAPQTMPVSSDIASRILCLPLFGELEEAHQAAIIEVVRQHTS